MVVHNKTHWWSIGFPSHNSWGWNKAKPKSSLYRINKANSANTIMLNFIEFAF